jgi:hypothetical protein
MKYLLAWRERTDQRLVEGVGVGNGHPGSCAMEGRSLLDDQLVDVEHTQGGQHNTTNMRNVATGGAARSSGGDPHDHPPPEKACTESFE